MPDIRLVNENGAFVAKDPETGVTIPIELGDTNLGDVEVSELEVGADGPAQSFADIVNSTEVSNIAIDAVGTDEVATDAIGADEIIEGAVGTSELASAAVTAETVASEGEHRQILTEDRDGNVVWEDRAVGETNESPERESAEFVGETLYDLDNDPASFWSDSTGTSETDTNAAFIGTESTHITNADTGDTRQYFYFDSPADLSHHSISAAVKWNSDSNVSPYMLLFDMDGNRLDCQFTAANDAPESGWVMGEFAPNEELDNETVNLEEVEKAHLVGPNDGNGVDFHIDNFRVVPYDPSLGGAVMFTADDSSATQGTVMRNTLNKYGYPSVHFVMSTNVGTDDTNHLNESQLDRMAENGCYISCHPQRADPLVDMTDSEAETAIDEEYEYVASRWGREHASYMSWPFSQRDEHLTDYVKQYHKLSFIGIGGGVGGWRTAAPMAVTRGSFADLDTLMTSLEFAEKYNRIFIPQFHKFDDAEPTGGVNCQPADFETFVDAVHEADVDVITPERLYEERQNAVGTQPSRSLDPDNTYTVSGIEAGGINIDTSGIVDTETNGAMNFTDDGIEAESLRYLSTNPTDVGLIGIDEGRVAYHDGTLGTRGLAECVDGVWRSLFDGSVVFPTYVESFESGDLSDFDGDVGAFNVAEADSLPFTPRHGAFVLENTGTQGEIYRTGSGFTKGKIGEAWFRYGSEPVHEWRMNFGWADASNNYLIRLAGGNDTLSLGDESGGGFETLEQTSLSQTLTANTLYRMVIIWDDGSLGGNENDITIRLELEDGTVLAEVSGNSASNEDNDGIAFRAYNSGTDDVLYWEGLRAIDQSQL